MDKTPTWLKTLAGYTWRTFLLLGALYLTLQGMKFLYLLFLPLFTSVLFAALLHPLAARLSKRMPRALSTTLTILTFVVVFAAFVVLVVNRSIAAGPEIGQQVSTGYSHLEGVLTRKPFNLNPSTFSHLSSSVTDFLSTHRSSILSVTGSAASTLLDFLTAAVLTLFFTVFFVHEGDRIATWFLRLLPDTHYDAARSSAASAWITLSAYVRGTLLVAAFHGVVVGVALTLLHVPLAIPLSLIIFVGSFIPIIGSLGAGALATIVTLVTQGPLAAIILVVVLVVDSQVEAHLLQPFVVGRYVRLHPLVVAAALVAGTTLAGIAGAIFVIPFVAGVSAVVRGWKTPIPVSSDSGSPELAPTKAAALERSEDSAEPAPPTPRPTTSPAPERTPPPAGSSSDA